METPITDKQLNYIIYRLFQRGGEEAQKLVSKLPSHDEIYDNFRADYTQAILEDKLLKVCDKKTASYIINFLEARNYRAVEQIFKTLGVKFNN